MVDGSSPPSEAKSKIKKSASEGNDHFTNFHC